MELHGVSMNQYELLTASSARLKLKGTGGIEALPPLKNNETVRFTYIIVALTWEPEGFRRRPGRPRQNWKDVVEKDLRKMGISWDEVEEAAEDRRSWRNRVARCVFDAG